MRLKKQEGIDLLRSVWLFERCSNRELDGLQRIATPADVPAGRALTTEGDIGREFFVIVRGKAETRRGDIAIATLEAGSFFGEMALLNRDPVPRQSRRSSRPPRWSLLSVHSTH